VRAEHATAHASPWLNTIFLNPKEAACSGPCFLN
jgi:hypothetical protein